MWDTEKQFGKSVMDKMKKEGMLPIRIESASTISGMPDLYVLGHNNDWFIELKNIKNQSIINNHWTIPWRPGQQAWAQQYAAYHTRRVINEFLSTKYSWTFVGLSDGVLLVRMSLYKRDNKLVFNDPSIFNFTMYEFKTLKLHLFLRTHSQVVTPILQKNMTWRQYISKQLEFDINEVLGHRYLDIDLPLPEDIVSDVEPKLKDRLDDIVTEYEWCDSSNMSWLQRNIAEQARLIYDSYINNEE